MVSYFLRAVQHAPVCRGASVPPQARPWKGQQHPAAPEADIDSRYKRFGHSGKQRHGILSVFISDTKVSASQ